MTQGKRHTVITPGISHGGRGPRHSRSDARYARFARTMARSPLFAVLACLALAASCLADAENWLEARDHDHSNDVRDVTNEKSAYEIEPLALMVGNAPSSFDNALAKQSALGWGYTTPRYRTSTSRWPTTRRPTTRWPTTYRTTTSSSKDQSFNIGGVYPYDRQLSSTPVYKKSAVFTINSLDFKYTDPARRTIHCIQVVDMQKNGKNAAVTVQSGGVGQNYINMKFKSQRGENINYLVIVWGQ